MRVCIFVILALVSVQVSGRTVTFNRYTVDSLVPMPHGDWAGDIDGTSPPYQLDIFATITVPAQAVWYANSNFGKSWSARKDVWTTPRDLYNLEIAGADFNDGDIDAISVDLALANGTVSSLGFSDNLGGGIFTTKIIGTLEGRIRQMRPADVDNDSDLDIVATVNTQHSQADIGLYWYENTGGMNFTEHFIGKCNPHKVDCFDDDGDGHLEIVVSEHWHGSGSTTDPCRLILYKNDGFEVFTPIVLDNTYGLGGAGVRCAKFDNDLAVDIVAGSMDAGILYWYRNNGGNNFTRHIIDNNCPELDGIDVGDFEPDGDMDIVAAGRDYWFRWYENDGNTPPNFIPHTIDAEYENFDLPYVTYLDGDTCPDIVLTEDSNNGHVFAYLNPCDPSGIEETEITPTNTYLKVPSLISSESVNLEYGIEERGDVRLEVIDITGRTVQVIENSGYKEPGAYKINWNLIGEPNGIYFLRLEAGNHLPVVKKITVIR